MRRILETGGLIGLAGGVVEVIWITFYSLIAAKDALFIASLITYTFAPSKWVFTFAGSVVGIVIHMFLSLLVGIVFAFFMMILFKNRRLDLFRAMGVGVSILLVIWAANFFLFLPVVNPSFLKAVPLGITLISKGLFGITLSLYPFFQQVRNR